MKIGINLLYLIPGVSGGTETYARGIISELFNDDTVNSYTIFISEDSLESFTQYRNVKIVTVPSFASNKIKRVFWEQCMFPFVLQKHGIEVLFSPGYVVPIFSSCRHIVTVHDMLYRRYPETIPAVKRWYWKIFVPLSLFRSKAVIAVSEFGRNEIAKYFPWSADKIAVTMEGVDRNSFFEGKQQPSMIRNKYSLPEKYVLCVATLSPHKNIRLLFEITSFLKKNGEEKINIVLVGNKERAIAELSEAMEELGIKEQVRMLGYLSQEDLCSVYSAASLFVLPSMYEGFGLPALEAMACGCPVACSNAGSLPEIAGDAAEYFGPNDSQGAAKVIKGIYFNEDKQNELRTRGFRNIERFTWNGSAHMTLKIFEAVYSMDRSK